MTLLLARLRRLASAQEGAAAFELVLVMPLLLLIVAGVADGGRLILQAMQVHAAAQAGADYARRYGWDPDRIQTAITTTASPDVAASPGPQIVRGCLQGGEIVATSGYTCPDGGTTGTYVTVYAQKTFDSLIPWSELSLPANLTAQSQVRIE